MASSSARAAADIRSGDQGRRRSNLTVTSWTPSTQPTAPLTCSTKRSQNGQLIDVRRMFTRTAAVVDLDLAHHPELDDVDRKLGVDNVLERLHHLGLHVR